MHQCIVLIVDLYGILALPVLPVSEIPENDDDEAQIRDSALTDIIILR
jgi:hypothetical protein